jgi:hypothetical protein
MDESILKGSHEFGELIGFDLFGQNLFDDICHQTCFTCHDFGKFCGRV